MKRLLVLLAVGCSPSPPPAAKTPSSPPAARGRPLPAIVGKMRALNQQMERLNEALRADDLVAAKAAAEQVARSAEAIDPEADRNDGYGPRFAAISGELKAAAAAMVRAVEGEQAGKALRHLHDQCLRCHDQAPAADGVGVCQLTE